jgi:hypothetical protein
MFYQFYHPGKVGKQTGGSRPLKYPKIALNVFPCVLPHLSASLVIPRNSSLPFIFFSDPLGATEVKEGNK